MQCANAAGRPAFHDPDGQMRFPALDQPQGRTARRRPDEAAGDAPRRSRSSREGQGRDECQHHRIVKDSRGGRQRRREGDPCVHRAGHREDEQGDLQSYRHAHPTRRPPRRSRAAGDPRLSSSPNSGVEGRLFPLLRIRCRLRRLLSRRRTRHGAAMRRRIAGRERVLDLLIDLAFRFASHRDALSFGCTGSNRERTAYVPGGVRFRVREPAVTRGVSGGNHLRRKVACCYYGRHAIHMLAVVRPMMPNRPALETSTVGRGDHFEIATSGRRDRRAGIACIPAP